MKLGIVGTRTFTDYEYLKKKILRIYKIKDIEEIVSGGAEGADTLAEQFAKEFDIPIKIYKPNWDKYGRKAGALRNVKIVNRSSVIIAFWDGKSPGTKITIDIAEKQKKQVHKVIL